MNKLPQCKQEEQQKSRHWTIQHRIVQHWKTQHHSIYALILSFTLALGVFTLPVQAQVEGILPLTDIGEGDARSLSSVWRGLAVGESHTYSFAYDGGDQPISIWMNTVPANGAEFQVWSEEALAAAGANQDAEPLGLGTPLGEGAGFSTWSGSAPDAGILYVLVTGTGETNVQYQLNISSAGLAVEQPAAAAIDETAGADGAAAPAATPDPTIAVVTTDALNVRGGPSTTYPVLTTVPNGTELTVVGRNALNTWIAVELADGTAGWVTRSLTNYANIAPVVETPPLPTAEPDPDATPDPNATPIEGEQTQLDDAEAEEALGAGWRLLPVGESDWYTFDHQGGELPVHIWMDIEPNEGAGFRVYTQENTQAIMAGSDPEDVDDIGRGTPNPLEPGYLFWRGTFEEAGTFYVLVLQSWQDDVYYSIHAAGPGLSRPAPAVEE